MPDEKIMNKWSNGMKKELCFIINSEKIYLEQILVECDNIPIFFLCKTDNNYFISLCVDIDNFVYVVTHISTDDVFMLFHGKIPMRDVITKQSHFWKIVSGEETKEDTVEEKNIDQLDVNSLPSEGATFEISSDSTRSYVDDFTKFCR